MNDERRKETRYDITAGKRKIMQGPPIYNKGENDFYLAQPKENFGGKSYIVPSKDTHYLSQTHSLTRLPSSMHARRMEQEYTLRRADIKYDPFEVTQITDKPIKAIQTNYGDTIVTRFPDSLPLQIITSPSGLPYNHNDTRYKQIQIPPPKKIKTKITETIDPWGQRIKTYDPPLQIFPKIENDNWTQLEYSTQPDLTRIENLMNPRSEQREEIGEYIKIVTQDGNGKNFKEYVFPTGDLFDKCDEVFHTGESNDDDFWFKYSFNNNKDSDFSFMIAQSVLHNMFSIFDVGDSFYKAFAGLLITIISEEEINEIPSFPPNYDENFFYKPFVDANFMNILKLINENDIYVEYNGQEHKLQPPIIPKKIRR